MTTPGTDAPRHTIRVELAARSYFILIQRNLFDSLGTELQRLGCSGKVGVVTDRHLEGLYLTRVSRILKAAGYKVVPIVLASGERTKTLHSISMIMDALVEAKFERTSTLLALGGGVIGVVLSMMRESPEGAPG